MSFEIIDNTFQVIVLAAMALLAFLLAFRRSSRSCLILAFGYASFMMGTLYYLLHLIILGHGPQVFYVAECSWMASYFFFLSLEILYWEGLHPPFSPFALAAGVVIAGVVMRVQVFGPSPLMSGVLALTFGALAYLCFSALQKEKRLRPYEIALLFEMSLQILLFVASEFIRDYTRFNLYYAVDILLTLTLVSFLPHILREEPHDLHWKHLFVPGASHAALPAVHIGQPPALYPVRGAGHGYLPAFGLCQQLFHGAAPVQCRDHRH